jgi:hypothetical protein
MLAFAMIAAIRVHANAMAPPPKNNAAQTRDAQPTSELTSPSLIRWSMQEIRRSATRLARKRIQPDFVIACSLWRRAQQGQAKRARSYKIATVMLAAQQYTPPQIEKVAPAGGIHCVRRADRFPLALRRARDGEQLVAILLQIVDHGAA